jgi:hypothetical protein
MAVKTGTGAQRQTAVAKSVSDLGALMSAKAEANTQPQPDIQVQAEVSVLPESTTNLTGVASVTKEADIQSTPATAQSEQTTKEETMSKNETTQAQAAVTQAQAPAAQVPAADQAPAATAAVAEAPLSSSEVMGDANTTAPTQTHEDLDKLLADATPDVNAALNTPSGMLDYLQGRDGRFKTLVAITKDTVGRVDALEAQIAELKKNGTTKTSTLTVKSPDWKDQIVDGLLMGSATAVGVFGIAYAFDAMFGQPRAAESSEPAIQ